MKRKSSLYRFCNSILWPYTAFIFYFFMVQNWDFETTLMLLKFHQLIFNFFMGWDYLKFAFTMCNDHIDGMWWMQSWYRTGWKDHSVNKFKYRSMKFLFDTVIWSHIVISYKNVFVPMFDNVTFIQFEITLSTLTAYWIEAWHHLALDNSTLLLFRCGILSY